MKYKITRNMERFNTLTKISKFVGHDFNADSGFNKRLEHDTLIISTQIDGVIHTTFIYNIEEKMEDHSLLDSWNGLSCDF